MVGGRQRSHMSVDDASRVTAGRRCVRRSSPLLTVESDSSTFGNARFLKFPTVKAGKSPLIRMRLKLKR